VSPGTQNPLSLKSKSTIFSCCISGLILIFVLAKKGEDMCIFNINITQNIPKEKKYRNGFVKRTCMAYQKRMYNKDCNHPPHRTFYWSDMLLLLVLSLLDCSVVAQLS